MPKVFYRCLTKKALLSFSKQPFVTQTLKYITQVLHMLLYRRAEHKDVIKVNSHATHQVGERQVHQTLERRRCIA